jgi:DNA-binding transcriptional regulator YiaG
VHFIRRALDQTQKDFAEAMDLSAEHVSRWENDHKGIGAASENLVRDNVCALLSEGCEYDPKTIANMQFIPYPDEDCLP